MSDQPDATSDQALKERLRAATVPHGDLDTDPVGAVRGRMRRRRARRRGIAVAAAAVLLVAVGVIAVAQTSDDESIEVVDQPDAGEPEKGPGTPIVGGIEVAPGSVLLGTAFPGPLGESGTLGADPDEVSRQWRSVLLIEGDPALVYDDYATRLAEEAVALEPGDPGAPCLRGYPVPDAATEGGPTPEFPTECQALGGWSQADLLHSSAVPGEMWANHLVLTIDTRDLEKAGSQPVTGLDGLGPPPRLFDDPGPPPPVPQVGEPVAPPEYDPMTEPVRVVEGSTLLAPAAPQGVTGGYVAVARITGDPAEVVARYVEQGRGENPETIYDEEYEVDGREVLHSYWDSAGGPKLYVTATTDEQGDWYALIDVGND